MTLEQAVASDIYANEKKRKDDSQKNNVHLIYLFVLVLTFSENS